MRWPWVRLQDLKPENTAVECQHHRGRRGAISGASTREPARQLRGDDGVGNTATLSRDRGGAVDSQGEFTGHSRNDNVQDTLSGMQGLSPVTETTLLPNVRNITKDLSNTQNDKNVSRKSRSRATKTRHNSLIPVTVHDIQDLRRKINFHIHVAYSNSVKDRKHRSNKANRSIRKFNRGTTDRKPQGRLAAATATKSKDPTPPQPDNNTSTITAHRHASIKSLHPIELPIFPPSPRFSDLPYARTDSTPLPLNALQRIATAESSLMDSTSAENEGRRRCRGNVMSRESVTRRRGAGKKRSVWLRGPFEGVLDLGGGGVERPWAQREVSGEVDNGNSGNGSAHMRKNARTPKNHNKDFVTLTPPPRGRSIAIFGSSQRRACTFSTFPSLPPSSKAAHGYFTAERTPQNRKPRSFRLVPLPSSSPNPSLLALSQLLPPPPPVENHPPKEKQDQREQPRETQREIQPYHQIHRIPDPPPILIAPRLSISFSPPEEQKADEEEEEEKRKRQWEDYRKRRRMEIEMSGFFDSGIRG